MEHWMLQEAVDRIRRMERCFDALLLAESEDPAAIREDASLREQLQILLQYYEGGHWLRDYELDEQGLLPPDLKRGVLSQDAVHDYLDQHKWTD